jgi:cytochrome P450
MNAALAPLPDYPTLPPGPAAPSAWQLLRFSMASLAWLESCARRYGDPFTVRFAGNETLVMLSSPRAVQDVFRGDPAVMHAGAGNRILRALVGYTSILVLDDAPHARMRRQLLPPLKGERLRTFVGAMQAETEAALTALPRATPVRIDTATRRITLRVIIRAGLGVTPGPAMEALERRMVRLLDYGNGPLALVRMHLWPPERHMDSNVLGFYRARRELDAALLDHIRTMRATPAHARAPGMLGDLITQGDTSGDALSDEELRDALVTVLAAGHETTALSLAWAMEQIVPRADVVQRIRAELAEVCAGEPPRAEHIESLTYLDAVIRECMRIRTVIPFVVRRLTAPAEVGGRSYPAGIVLAPCIHLVHRRADLYPDPAAFRPERFLERKYGPHEWLPFGGGHRACLGMVFALYEMKAVLGTLFARADFARPPGAQSQVARRGISMAPSDGTRLLIHDRH